MFVRVCEFCLCLVVFAFCNESMLVFESFVCYCVCLCLLVCEFCLC